MACHFSHDQNGGSAFWRILEEFFAEDSDDGFLGFEPQDIVYRPVNWAGNAVTESESNDSRDGNVSDGYDHEWLRDFQRTAGPTNVPDGLTEVGYFQFFFTDEVIDLFVQETNRYATQMARDKPTSPRVQMCQMDSQKLSIFSHFLLMRW